MPLTVRQRSIHSKNGAKRTTSFNKGKNRKNSQGEFLVTNAPSDLRSIAYPGGAVALGLLLVARLLAAFYGHIADCDETFNYWEPLHYLVYGTGLQTWEYSPEYAIRSYMPLWLFAVPAKMMSFIMSPVSIFYTLRALLAMLGAGAEFMFYKAVCHEFGVHVGRVWLCLTLVSAGGWASAGAMLPSAWSASLASAAVACHYRHRHKPAVIFTALNTLISWPFTAILGVSIVIDMLIIKRKYVDFIKWSALSFVAIMVPTVAIDSWHYGKLVVAPWNIVAYNIFTDHGPDLYGVEPWTYYFVNGFLNFNIVWVLCLVSASLLACCRLVSAASTARAEFCSPYWLDLLPLALWLAVFLLQPHKEERFLYPIYSLIILAGAISIDCLQKMTFAIGTELFKWRKERERRHYLAYTGPLMVIFILVAGLGGVSRIASLYKNYSGPMTILSKVPHLENGTVCFGKEWYRSPSSFHLGGGVGVRFIRSEFNGQMPAPYSTDYNATRIIHPHFNDKNKGDRRTYLDPKQCNYLVDSDIGTPTPLQPAYYKDTNTWEIKSAVKMLDAEKSHRIYRAFYVPGLSERHNVYGNLYLLKNKLLSK